MIGLRSWTARCFAVLYLYGLGGEASTAQSCSGNTTISDAASVTALVSSCSTYTGNIVVQSLTVPPSEPTPTLSLQQLVAIKSGSLEFSNIFDDAVEKTISLPKLATIEGSLAFENLTSFLMPDVSHLGNADTISFRNVSFGQSAAFGTPQFKELTYAQNLLFTNCPGLTNIGPLQDSYAVTQGGYVTATITATGNPDLQSISLNGYSDTKTTLDISENNPTVRVSTDVVSASLFVQQVGFFQAQSLANILRTDDTMSNETQFISDCTMTSLSLPELHDVQNVTFQISNNTQLADLEFSQLQNSDNIEIIGNDHLDLVDLSKLNQTSGSLNISGPLLHVFLPNLTESDFQGQVNITYSPDVPFNCSSIVVPKDQLFCNAAAVPLQTPGTTASPPGPSTTNAALPPHRGLSTTAKIGIGVGIGIGIPLLLGAVFFFGLVRQRYRSRSPRSMGAGNYSMTERRADDRSPARYSKVNSAGSVEEVEVNSPTPISHHHERTHSDVSDEWVPAPQQRVESMENRVELEEQQGERHELEEQQGMRHEMDARSLPDIEISDEDEETRSLQDIERTHGRD